MRAGHETFSHRHTTSSSGFTEIAAAEPAGRRHLPRIGARLALAQDRTDHLGNDVAALLDDDQVAVAHVAARDLLGVVERGERDDGARQAHRLEHRERRDGPGAADVRVDAEEPGRRLLGRKLEGDRPAGELRRGAKPLAQCEVVDLDDDAVGFEGETPALVVPAAAVRHHLLEAGAPLPVRLHRQSPPGERLERFGVRVRGPIGTGRHDDLIGEGTQSPPRDGGRVEGPDRAGGGIARIRERRLAGRLALRVHAGEGRPRQVDLAANFDERRCLAGFPESQRNGANDAHVGRDVLAPDAVAARHAPRQPALPVGQRDAEAVDLQLRHVRQRGVGRLVERAADARVKLRAARPPRTRCRG